MLAIPFLDRAKALKGEVFESARPSPEAVACYLDHLRLQETIDLLERLSSHHYVRNSGIYGYFRLVLGERCLFPQK